MKRNFAFVAAILCLCAIVCGCSKGPKKPADLPKLNPTTVTVTYDDGSPVDGATIAFLPAQTGGRTWNLTGVTDASGKVAFKTDGNWDGAPAGEYRVIVSKEVAEVEEPTEVGGSLKTKSITRFVAEKFGGPNTSGLTATIKDGETNNLEFKVGEKIEENVKAL